MLVFSQLSISLVSFNNIALFSGTLLSVATRFGTAGNSKISVDIPAILNTGKNKVDLLSLTVGLAVSNI